MELCYGAVEHRERVNREVHARFWERAEVQWSDFVEEVGEQFEVNQPVIRGTPIASR